MARTVHVHGRETRGVEPSNAPSHVIWELSCQSWRISDPSETTGRDVVNRRERSTELFRIQALEGRMRHMHAV